MSKSGDDTARNLKDYLSREHPVVEPIPSKKVEKKDEKKETPKNDDFNEYDYSDDKELDDRNW